MNKLKALFAGLLLPLLIVFVPTAHAGLGYYEENENGSYEFWQGDDWGKVNSTRTELTPRDGECDGRAVYFLIWIDGDPFGGYRKLYDNNGCDAGGGSYTPSRSTWNKVRLCEQVSGSDDFCTPILTYPLT